MVIIGIYTVYYSDSFLRLLMNLLENRLFPIHLKMLLKKLD